MPATLLRLAAFALLCQLAAPLHAASAQAPRIEQLEQKVLELQRQIEVLVGEIETLKLGEAAQPEAKESRYGLGPAASKVYDVPRRSVSIGGYGELLYENFAAEREDGSASGRKDQIDFLRAVVYLGYKLSDRWVLNSELEFEHASTDDAGSVSVEFATLDYLYRPELNFRAGLLLVPMGFINELHEPPIFLGAKRPPVEQVIIPTTWRENGIGVFGSRGMFSYRAYAVAGLDGAGVSHSGFSAAGLRGGRQRGSQALADDVAFVGRLDAEPRPGLLVGGSLYSGGSGQGALTPAGEPIEARTTIGELHFDLKQRGLWLRGLWARAAVDEAEKINALRGLTGDRSVGSVLGGWYLQAGYDLLSHRFSGDDALIPYLRYERLDTQIEVPDGFAVNPQNDQRIFTFGVAYKPLLNVIFKADYQWIRNQADTGVDQINLALGYLF